MAGTVDVPTRNLMIRLFRERICERMEVIPFAHQARWWAASDGHILSPVRVETDRPGMLVRTPSGGVERWMLDERPTGPARFLALLGSYKIGKSFSAGVWGAAFACIPDARVSIVGIEYDICEPEFNYIVESLCSSRGLGMKPKSLQNNPRNGQMFLEFENGARFQAKSWERKDSLKGKEIDAYIFAEAYQLPGVECFTENQQNLNARQGFAVFATTPDRPWLKELHHLGHGEDSEWFCECNVSADRNPYTFDQKAKDRDVNLMTREKYAIHYLGQLGDFVGRVYSFQRGQRVFDPSTHPSLFDGGSGPENLRIPDGWEVVSGADTGTFYAACTVAFSPTGDAFVIDEYPNYHYIAGQPERDEGITIPQWCRAFERGTLRRGARPVAWADKNSQFKRELAQYGVALLPSPHPLETRTEITREYFQHGRIWLAPWLSVLPFELENAEWPEETTAAGKFQRIKDRDHTLDCLEHVLSRRPQGRHQKQTKRAGSAIESILGPKIRKRSVDPHLGAL